MTDPLPHGWEPADIYRLARIAASRPSSMIDGGERHDIAALAAIEYLYTSGGPYGWPDLMRAAANALAVCVRREYTEHGIPVPGTDHTGARYGAYWHGTGRVISPMEDRIIDALALRQVLPLVSPRRREVLRAVARHWGDRTAAARELGITRVALLVALSRARAEFRWFWFWPESAPRHWGHDHDYRGLGTRHADGSNRAMAAIRDRRRRKESA